MLRLIFIDETRQGYVDPAGQCYELDGTLISESISYTLLDEAPPQPGWYTPPPNPPQPQPSPIRYITKLAFRNRFTDSEKTTIELKAAHNESAALNDQQMAAYLRAMLSDQRDATYIDLDRQDTRNGVLQLENYGLIGNGRAIQILDSPINQDEIFTR